MPTKQQAGRPRHHCPTFTFTEGGKGDLNSKYCSECICLVCDEPASECPNWFGGKGGDDCTDVDDADADSSETNDKNNYRATFESLQCHR